MSLPLSFRFQEETSAKAQTPLSCDYRTTFLLTDSGHPAMGLYSMKRKSAGSKQVSRDLVFVAQETDKRDHERVQEDLVLSSDGAQFYMNGQG